ncbi:hypothetical protein EI94DRAFT_1706260 [Lactarius quietus]|nr:hypothetical protein EI94DRAFT_1706260 [Lactarius quietus]
MANNVKAGDWVAKKRVDQGDVGVHEKSEKIGQEENRENRGERSEKNRERGGWDKRTRGTGRGLGARVTQTGIKMMNLLEDRSWVTWDWHHVHTWEDTPKGVPTSSTSLAVLMMQHTAEDELHTKRRPILFVKMNMGLKQTNVTGATAVPVREMLVVIPGSTASASATIKSVMSTEIQQKGCIGSWSSHPRRVHSLVSTVDVKWSTWA